jgi:hypothetical protein
MLNCGHWSRVCLTPNLLLSTVLVVSRTPVSGEDDRCDGLTHIAQVTQSVSLLDLPDVGREAMIAENVRDPSGKVSAARVLADATRVTLL